MKIKNKIVTASVLAMLVSTSACTMIPDYLKPDFSAAQQWNEVEGYEKPVGEKLAQEMDWKEFFQSQELWLVVGTALQNNKDYKTALLNIEEARSIYRIERSDLFPSLNANGSANYQRTPDAALSTNVIPNKTETYSANIGLSSYEVDLFGRVRSLNEAALNEFLATQNAAAVVRNALIAETANAYLQLLADQKLLELTQQTLDAQQKTYDILSKSLEKGISTEQDVARVETAVETARVNLHLYKRMVAQDKNALFMLMGVPNNSDMLPEVTIDDITIRNEIKMGLPSEVLLLRPDVKQAEYELLARNADIGAARAAFFPSITLTGNYGYASQGLSSLFTSGAADAWSFAPQISIPIFQGGANVANLDLAKIRKEKAIVNYEKQIQVAFREVSDELATRQTLDEQLQAQRRLVQAAQKVYDISDARYKSGIDSFLSVLDAQRELYAYQQEEIQLERQKLTNLVNLYKVLGGGSY